MPGKGKSGNISFTLGNNLEMKWRDKNDSLKKVSLIDAFDVSMSYNLSLIHILNFKNGCKDTEKSRQYKILRPFFVVFALKVCVKGKLLSIMLYI